MAVNPKRVKEIFLEASELSGEAARAAYLDRACGGDAGLRERVEALLRSYDPEGTFLDAPTAMAPDPDQTATHDFAPGPAPVAARAHDDGAGAYHEPLTFLAPPTRPDALGRMGHYEVLQVLGQGGFGIVLRAFDDMLHRIVAVKVLSPQLAATSPARKRFLREARSSARVRHENVVQVYEVGEQPLPYIAMEFVPGETLQQRLDRDGPLDVPDVLRIGRQVAEGLAAAHATDLIHRDIKPDNVLLEGGTQRAKITDFGLARAADDASLTQSGAIAGTPMYMAPEQARGETLDQRADLFSLGSVLYQMATGRPPFPANGTLAVLKRVAEDAPRPIREIIPETPPWLCDVISKLHAKNPADRFDSAREVAEVLADGEARLKADSKMQHSSRSQDSIPDCSATRQDRNPDPRSQRGRRPWRPAPRRGYNGAWEDGAGRFGRTLVAKILIIDDDGAFSRRLRAELERQGYGVACLERAEGGPDVLATGEFDLVLLDNQLPGMSGIEFLGALKRQAIRLPVILMTSYGTADAAIEATRLGAYAYVIKPGVGETFRELEPMIPRALAIDWRPERVRLPGDAAPEDDSGPQLLGNSRPMRKVCELIGLCADGDVPILVRGETGAGKELVARSIHAHGPRKDRPFVVVNCTAADEDGLDDELFGHEPGAFPGADKVRKGSFEHADGGTLFLDEVGALPPRIQAKLLGVLESRAIARRGGESAPVQVRLLAATRRDLNAAMREGKFLEKLFYRLNQMPIPLPPLRDRGPDDLRLLVDHFLKQVARSTGRPAPALQADAWDKLHGYAWPGNVWELQNVVGRAALVCRGPCITAADVEFDVSASGDGEVLAAVRQAIGAALQSGQSNLAARLRTVLHRELLLLTLTQCGGDQQKAERILGVPLSSLLEQNAAAPDAAERKEAPRSISFQAEALILIANHPSWTAIELAEALGCSKAKLYRDPIVNRALKGRSAGHARPPSGYKTREGDLEAYE